MGFIRVAVAVPTNCDEEQNVRWNAEGKWDGVEVYGMLMRVLVVRCRCMLKEWMEDLEFR